MAAISVVDLGGQGKQSVFMIMGRRNNIDTWVNLGLQQDSLEEAICEVNKNWDNYPQVKIVKFKMKI